MPLRLRLTLLYIILVGGVLLIFGSMVYGLVSVVLLDQVDTTLAQAANQIIERIRYTSTDQVDPRSLADFQSAESLVIQVWGRDRRLQFARPAVFQTSLDETSLSVSQTIFRSSQKTGSTLRVVSVPLITNRGPVGVLQVGLNQNLLDIARRTLATVVILLACIGMILSGWLSWWLTGRALAPLATMTRVATQITRADDLSRRIPMENTETGDEVGQLVVAFNETMERLEHLFTAQRRFLADVSHELRTPLTVIKGNVGLMRRIGLSDDESIQGIEAEVDRLTRLVGDLLLLAQAESGRIPLDLGIVELDTVLLEVFQHMLVLTSDRLSLKLTEIDQIQVTGDRDRLKQVALNLVGNAIQYTPAGGSVTVALRRVGERAQLVVSDTGPGIPAQDLPHIFERFYRGEKSRTRRGQSSGFGLGLSIAYWIIKGHNGTIEVNTREGQGTTFSVWLPVRS